MKRQRFIGAHVTEPVKVALDKEAEKRKISVSRLVYESLRDAMRNAGHDIPYEIPLAPR